MDVRFLHTPTARVLVQPETSPEGGTFISDLVLEFFSICSLSCDMEVCVFP